MHVINIVNMMCSGREGQGGQHRVQVAGGVSNILIFKPEQGLDLAIYFIFDLFLLFKTK